MATRIRDLARRAGIKREINGKKLVKWVLRMPGGRLIPMSYQARLGGAIKEFRPGVWMAVDGPMYQCRNGLHCTVSVPEHVKFWKPLRPFTGEAGISSASPELWEVEAAEMLPGTFHYKSKHAFRFMKLVKRIQ